MESQRKLAQKPAASWLLWLAPNLPILLLAACGWLAESLLLSLGRDSIYRMAGVMPILSGLMLAWFWLTWGWILWGAVCALRFEIRRMSTQTVIRTVAFAVIAVMGIVTYIASWGFYLRAGRFIGLQILLRVA